MNDFQGKTVAVLGLARAGIPAARFLAEKGARVIGYDDKTREKLTPEALELEKLGVELQTGEHNFVGLEKCDLIVLSPGLKIHFEPLKTIIEAAEARGAEVIGELELASRFCPAPIVAVTGTKGKSTTVKLITEMLQACGVEAVAAGNTGTPLIAVLPQLSAQSWAVVEVSSFQLEKAPTFRPRVAVLLSLLEDHQDYHPTLEQYWETKLKIFANQGDGDVEIFNVDDQRIYERHRHYGNKGCLDIYTTGQNLSADLTPDNVDFYWRDDVLHSSITPLVSDSEFPLKGQHNRANASAALAAVWAVLGCEWDLIAQNQQPISEAIRNFQSLPHRLEIVAEKDGVRWVNDSQSTIPDAAIAALGAFPAPVTLIAGGKSKLADEAYQGLARAIAQKAARLITIGEAAEMLEKAAKTAGMAENKIFCAKTLTEAVKIAKIQATQGETVVLSPACASFDQFSSYEERGEVFRTAVLSK